MWNTPNSKTGWNLDRDRDTGHTEYFTLNGVPCYYDFSTDKYYAFLGITGNKKVEFNTKESLVDRIAKRRLIS